MNPSNSPAPVWLIAGGAPRSGTTALGRALNMSKEIAIIHEYQSHAFFSALDGFFREEDRMRQFADFERKESQFPTRKNQGKDIAMAVFASLFPEKSPRFIGTKSPSYDMLVQPVYPDWISSKTIHITRNPYDVTLSALKKSLDEGRSATLARQTEFFTHLNRWCSAWNHAIAHADDKNFLHLFYDDLILDPEAEKQRASAFLDGVSDFNFRGFKVKHAEAAADRFVAAGLGEFMPVMESIAPVADWLESAKRDFQQRKMVATPSAPKKKGFFSRL